VEIIPEGGQSPASESPADLDLFFGTIDDMERYYAQARAYVKSVKDSGSVRLIVVETWLFVDFTVRGLLMSSLQFDRADHEDLDLGYALLPRGFRECASLLQKLVKVNQNLPSEIEKRFTGSARKWAYLDQFDPGLQARIATAEESYRHSFHPGTDDEFSVRKFRYRSVPEGWLEVAGNIDESWVKRANRLNDARNLAAHCHEETRIAAKLGFHGSDTLNHVRDECLRLSKDLVGISACLGPVSSNATAR